MQEAVEDGITFGGVFRHTSGSVFWVEEPDPDAAAFIAASGATDVWNIQKFVQGVKALGLWDDMVCWPLRSAQNAGTGTTAYSLGGLGTFNGTLVNGPTWGVDGVNFDGSNDRIDLPTIPLDNTASLFYVTAYSDSNEQKPMRVNGLELGAAFTSNEGIEAVWLVNPNPLVGRTTVISGLGANVRHSAAAVFDAANTTISRFYNGANKLSNVSASLSGTPDQVAHIGARSSNNSLVDGVISVAAYLSVPMSDSQVAALDTLYKQTLGIGLGLP
jgi:hypothetical protein